VTRKQRQPYFDFMRGVAILMVMGLHTHEVADLNLNHGFTLLVLVKDLMAVAVPVFLGISGYFLCGARLDTRVRYCAFEKRHLLRVYVPMLIFSIPYVYAATDDVPGLFVSVGLAFVGYYMIYYFVFLIAQLYLLLPVIRKLMRHPLPGFAVCAVLCVAGNAVYAYYFGKGEILPLCVSHGLFPINLIYFAMGCYAGMHGRDYSPKVAVAVAVVAQIMIYVEYYMMDGAFAVEFCVQLTKALYSCVFLLMMFSARTESCYYSHRVRGLSGFMERVGRLSFFVYLSHMHFYMVLLYLGLLTKTSWLMNFLSVTTLTLAAAFVLAAILPPKACRVLGLS